MEVRGSIPTVFGTSYLRWFGIDRFEEADSDSDFQNSIPILSYDARTGSSELGKLRKFGSVPGTRETGESLVMTRLNWDLSNPD